MRAKLIVTAAVATLAAATVAIPAIGATTTKTVNVGDDYFVKNSGSHKVTVKKGTKVKWVWRGSSPHDVTVTKGPAKFKSATLEKGSYSRTLTKTGTYSIICTIHEPDMRMTLAVTR